MDLLGKNAQATRNVSLSIDTENVHDGIELAKAGRDFVDSYKVNRVFIQAADAGFPLVARLQEIKPKKEGSVFVDCKWYDSPGTVYGYAFDVSRMYGVSMFTIHISGGKEMCQAALEGAEAGIKKIGGSRVGEGGIYQLRRPRVIGITELTTSKAEDYEKIVMERAKQAKKWGLDGIVASGKMAGQLRNEFGSDLIRMYPGMDIGGIMGREQVHTYRPEDVMEKDPEAILIAGRAITQARNKNEIGYDFVRQRLYDLNKLVASKI